MDVPSHRRRASVQCAWRSGRATRCARAPVLRCGAADGGAATATAARWQGRAVPPRPRRRATAPPARRGAAPAARRVRPRSAAPTRTVPAGGARRRSRRLHGRVPRRRPGPAGRRWSSAGRRWAASASTWAAFRPRRCCMRPRSSTKPRPCRAHGVTFGAPQIDLDKLRDWKNSVVAQAHRRTRRASPSSARSKWCAASAGSPASRVVEVDRHDGKPSCSASSSASSRRVPSQREVAVRAGRSAHHRFHRRARTAEHARSACW